MNQYDVDGFDVHCVKAAELEDLNVFLVCLSDAKDGNGEVFILQAGLSFDDQDRALGQDKYCISTASGATVYGGLTRCTLHDNLLTLDLNPTAAETLGVAQSLRFPLRIDSADVERLREGLNRVLRSGSSATIETEL